MRPGSTPLSDRAVLSVEHRGLWRQAWGRLWRNRLAAGAIVVLGAVLTFAVLTEIFSVLERHDWQTTNYERAHSGPSSDNWLGTDDAGRDLWARAWEGTRISLKIGLGSQAIVLTIGLLVGGLAALGGRITDGLMMRFTDLVYAFPDLLAIILVKSILSERNWPIIGTGDPQIPGFPGELIQVILAISLVAWVLTARLVRGQMLALRETDYVLAARSIGASSQRIVFVHMLPNTLGPVIAVATIGIPTAIFAEATLGFIGFSLPPPTASLGTLVNDGYTYFRINLWEILVPTGAIATLMLAFTFLGDGLQDALNPRSGN